MIHLNNKSLFVFLLVVAIFNCDNIRLLATDPIKDDFCSIYGYIDANGNWNDQPCTGCKKQCRKCDDGYYLNSKYNCKPYPNNCISVDQN